MPLTTLTTGISAPLNGSITIPVSLIDPSAKRITLTADVLQHQDGNPTSLTISFDVSLDGGLTWMLGATAERSQGSTNYPVFGLSSDIVSDGKGDLLRMVRATLTTTNLLVTSMQLIPKVA